VFGAIDYSRSPSGSGDILSPVSFSVSADDFSELTAGCIPSDYWGISYLEKDNLIDVFGSDTAIVSSTLSHVFSVDIPIGKEITAVAINCADNLNNTPRSLDNYGVDLEGHGDPEGSIIFTIISASYSTAMFEVPTTTASDLTANITSQLGDTGTLALIVIVASIPLAFYVIKKIIGLVPKK